MIAIIFLNNLDPSNNVVLVFDLSGFLDDLDLGLWNKYYDRIKVSLV